MARESSMADRREYVRVSVSLPMNPKLGMVDDPAASWLYVVSLCHCGEYLTDGVFIPGMVARVAGVPSDLGKRLVSVGMWHEPGHDCPRCPQPPEGHLVVHDYLMHQRSKAQAEQVRAAGQTAANARWGKRDAKGMRSASGSQSDPHMPDGTNGTRTASEPDTTPPNDADRMRTAYASQCDSDATPNAEVEVEVEGEVDNPSSPYVGGSGGDASQQAAPPNQGRKRGTRILKDWTPSVQKRESLTSRFPRPSQWWLDETEKFVNWFLQKAGRDATSLDWDARFDVWIREAIRREGGDSPAPTGRGAGRGPTHHVQAGLARDVDAPEYDPIAARLNGTLPIGEPA